MRAVNLIPVDMRRGGGAGAAGRTGGAIYVLVAALVGLVAMAFAYGVTSHRITQRKIDVATATREAQVAEARAAALQPYVEVQTRRTARVALVSQIANKRFDWSVAMAQIAEVLPSNVILTNLVGNNSPTASAGGGGAGSALRNSLPVPAVQLTGCAPTQPGTAAALDALQRIPGVTVTSLGSSVKGGAGGSGSGASAASGSTAACHGGPNFNVIVFYTNPTARNAPQETAVAANSAPATTTAPGASR